MRGQFRLAGTGPLDGRVRRHGASLPLAGNSEKKAENPAAARITCDAFLAEPALGSTPSFVRSNSTRMASTTRPTDQASAMPEVMFHQRPPKTLIPCLYLTL